MTAPSLSLLSEEISQPRDTPSGPEKLTLTEEQLAVLQECIDWKNARLGARPDDVKSKHAYAEVFTTKDGYHKVRVDRRFCRRIDPRPVRPTAADPSADDSSTRRTRRERNVSRLHPRGHRRGRGAGDRGGVRRMHLHCARSGCRQRGPGPVHDHREEGAVMRYRIHYTLADGTEDSVVVSGDTIEEVREQAHSEVARRGGTDPWSEEL